MGHVIFALMMTVTRIGLWPRLKLFLTNSHLIIEKNMVYYVTDFKCIFVLQDFYEISFLSRRIYWFDDGVLWLWLKNIESYLEIGKILWWEIITRLVNRKTVFLELLMYLLSQAVLLLKKSEMAKWSWTILSTLNTCI